MADLDQFQPLYPEERVLAPLLERAADSWRNAIAWEAKREGLLSER
jgi:hypothetical protein